MSKSSADTRVICGFCRTVHPTRAAATACDDSHRKSSADKPPVHRQGKCIVERDETTLLVLCPDGEIARAATEKHAEKIAKKWFKQHAKKGSIGIGAIEWRDGIKPPKEQP